MNGRLAGFLVAFGAIVAPGPLAAQTAAAQRSPEDREIASVRKTLAQQRREYIGTALYLTPTEAKMFWPVYDQYSAELALIGDRRFASLKAFAAAQGTMTPEQAVKWVQQVIQQDRDTEDLRLKYVPIVAMAIPGRKVAEFFNLDRRTQMLIDLDLPLKH